MQANLKSLFAGKREAAEVPPKRGPGRPAKVRKEEEDEARDVVAEALYQMPDQHEAYDEQLRLGRRKRKFAVTEGEQVGENTAALREASGKRLSDLRMPGCTERDSTHEGPQVKLRLCKWLRKTYQEIGGTDEDYEMLLRAVAENWKIHQGEVLNIIRNEAKWASQCEQRGVIAYGLMRDEAHLPKVFEGKQVYNRNCEESQGWGQEGRVEVLVPHCEGLLLHHEAPWQVH